MIVPKKLFQFFKYFLFLLPICAIFAMNFLFLVYD